MGTRESAQDKTAANGSCLSTAFCLRIAISRSKELKRSSMKRRLPSINTFRASSGVTGSCARTLLGEASSSPAAATQPAAVAVIPNWRNFRREESSLRVLWGIVKTSGWNGGTGRVEIYCDEASDATEGFWRRGESAAAKLTGCRGSD